MRRKQLVLTLDSGSAEPPPPASHSSNEEVLKHAVLECMASIIITYSCIYTPEHSADPFCQFISSICLFSIIITMKDSRYFCPDITPLTTTILYAAGLYTNKNGETDWSDIFGRIAGQLFGFVLVFFIAMYNKVAIAAFGLASRNHFFHSSRAVAEGLGTMFETIATAYATIPLVSPYESKNDLESKLESIPPDSASLLMAAFSLASIHYTLERLFQASMNPLITILQSYLSNSEEDVSPVVFCQLLGLLAAFGYVQWCAPTKDTMEKLRKRK